MSFRLNQSDMKNYSTQIIKLMLIIYFIKSTWFFCYFETGKSITLGLDFKKEKSNDLNQINKYFEFVQPFLEMKKKFRYLQK